MLEVFLFELTLSVMSKVGAEHRTVIVNECPTKEKLKEMNTRYSVPGFRVYVNCTPTRGTPM